jgi:hypothetical protein
VAKKNEAMNGAERLHEESNLQDVPGIMLLLLLLKIPLCAKRQLGQYRNWFSLPASTISVECSCG